MSSQSTQSSTFLLEKHLNLFRDEQSFSEFVNALKSASKGDFTLVLTKHEIIGAVLSASATKKVLCDRMVQSIARNPELLSEMADRIENDKIVE